MRLFEAIIDANHRAVGGDTTAGLHPDEFADSLPVIALTCIDPRLNAYFPNALALPSEQFIWLRNAGNIITGTLSSTMRSLALACAVKGGREIAIIGHTDCQVAKTPMMALLDRFKELGIDRATLPDNISDFFGTFGSERQNVIKACDFVRNSPLIGRKIPVHGLLLDLSNGSLNWVVNGYQELQTQAQAAPPVSAGLPKPGAPLEPLGAFNDFAMGEMKFPETKIGEVAARVENAVSDKAAQVAQRVVPIARKVEEVAGEVAQYADQNWPKPPPLRPRGSTLPPLKKNPPPPIRPNTNFRRH